MEKFNIYSAILNVLPDDRLLLVQKYRNRVLVPVGGVSLLEKISSFSREEKLKIFANVLRGLAGEENKRLFSSRIILYLYDEILSQEIKEDPAHFNAMLEALQEQGIFYPRNLQLIHQEVVGDGHQKVFFLGKEYIFFSFTGGKLHFHYIDEKKYIENREEGRPVFPTLGKDFFQQDGDIEEPHLCIPLAEILSSFSEKGDVSQRYGRGAHRKALSALLAKSSFLVQNRELAPLALFVR